MRLWKLWRSFGDKEPLFPGGLVNWPDWVIHDFRILEWQHRIIKQEFETD
ncbi:MAG: hypothetical protein GVY30_00200 [Chloroflexi bacterium]|jgi:hypothetical protein|nr:hypothetical protein [Chloroflexota bacterium]